MQPRTVHLIIFSALLLTLACGAEVLWLVLQNPTLAPALFYAALGLFTAGTGAIISLIRALHSKGAESPPLLPEAPVSPIGGGTGRESATRRAGRHRAPRALPKPPNDRSPHVTHLGIGRGPEC
jgi:hypothetical protein